MPTNSGGSAFSRWTSCMPSSRGGFHTMAFSDVGLQNCFFPDGSRNTQHLLKNLPLRMAFLSSFVFIIFPTKKEGHQIQ